MKNKNILKLFIFFIIFAGCEVKWDMEISFDDDFSGSYSIAVLIDQEAQMYAVGNRSVCNWWFRFYFV